MSKPIPPLRTRADIYALDLRAEAKVVLLWLLDQPVAVYERAEVAKHLGTRAIFVENGIVFGQRRPPFVFARELPDGTPLRGRHAYIPDDAPVRAAWANRAGDAPPRGLSFDEVKTAPPPEPETLTDADEAIRRAVDSISSTAKRIGDSAFELAITGGMDRDDAALEATTIAAYTDARERGETKEAARAFGAEVARLARRALAHERADRTPPPDEYLADAMQPVEPPPWERELPGTADEPEPLHPDDPDELARLEEDGRAPLAEELATDPTDAIGRILSAATPAPEPKPDTRFKKKTPKAQE